VGTSGSGKTYAAKGLVERLMDRGARVCVVDPLGVWWGMRAGADGAASPSPYPVVVVGGRHAAVALDEGMGAAFGRLVGTHEMACVVDVSDLGSASARHGFMTAFTEALYAANTQPLHLVLDEADRAEGRRILGALPRLARGEGWVWAPSDSVLARVAFPRIRTFDSSQTPLRPERAAVPGGLVAVDLAAIAAALAGSGVVTAGHGDPSPPGDRRAADLDQRLRQQDRELPAARARVAELEAEAAAVRAWPEQVRGQPAFDKAASGTTTVRAAASRSASAAGSGVRDGLLDHVVQRRRVLRREHHAQPQRVALPRVLAPQLLNLPLRRHAEILEELAQSHVETVLVHQSLLFAVTWRHPAACRPWRRDGSQHRKRRRFRPRLPSSSNDQVARCVAVITLHARIAAFTGTLLCVLLHCAMRLYSLTCRCIGYCT